MAEHFRGIVREQEFEEEVHALIPDVVAADDFLQAAETLLACDPEIGTQLTPGSDVWLLPMGLISDEEVYLYYTFDAETVYLIAFRRVLRP